MADNTTELEVLDEIVDVLGGQSGQHETVVPVLEDIRDLLGGGGGGGGYNPALSVGRADALTGADSTAQWATRESTGTGSATVRSVQGASVAWEQWRKPSDGSATGTYSGVSYVRNNDGSVKVGGTASGEQANIYPYVFQAGELIIGHKYLIRGCSPAGGSSTTYFGGIGGSVQDVGNGCIYTNAAFSSNTQLRICVRDGATIPESTLWPQFFDLTAMFGAGNEPQSVAEFEQMFPASYYPYSAPTLKPVQIAGIASTDAQGGELDAIEWTAQTLRAAGSVADMLYSDHVDVRVGVVDLGTLSWDYNTQFSCFAGNIGVVAPTAKQFFSGTCAKYPFVGSYQNLTDKTSGYIYNTFVAVKDADYGTDTAAFKAAMAGVMLYYELATPTTTPISPALDMTYKVQAGGRESIIVPAGEVSAAPVLTVAEGESAADVVMDALACIAAPDGPVAASSHAVGTYLTMQGKLYKVTSAIAVGETIKSGTNVSETTVMAELIARTA